MISRELVSHDRNCIDIASKQEIIIGNERSFKFDRVFKETSTQDEVYDECVRDLVIGCFEGYNAAVLAYGQTGSNNDFRKAGRLIRWERIQLRWNVTNKVLFLE